MPLLISESPYYGAGSITREQFLFYEMRTTARLMREGLSDEEILKRIVEENLFQYPTEKTIKQTAGACIRRLHALNDPDLVDAIATLDLDTSKQVCLYAMMKQYRLSNDEAVSADLGLHDHCDRVKISAAGLFIQQAGYQRFLPAASGTRRPGRLLVRRYYKENRIGAHEGAHR